MASSRRTPLLLVRAVKRLDQDMWDDLWTEPTAKIELPAQPAEFRAAATRLAAMRRTAAFPPVRIPTVPKPDGLSRPAHLLPWLLRAYYQALVDSFLFDVDAKMVNRANVPGYRATGTRNTSQPFERGITQWKRFRKNVKKAARDPNLSAAVKTDIVGFFEQIPHDRLESRLLSMGVRADVAAEIRAILRWTAGGNRGIPQGTDASSVLANIYLDPLDRALLSAGYTRYFRYVDDIWIFCRDEPDARRALQIAEREVRDLQLLLQSAKTRIFVGRGDVVDAVTAEDDEIAASDYAIARRPRRIAAPVARQTWRSISRRRDMPKSHVKYMLRQLRELKDPIAVPWCLRNLGRLDWLANRIAPYLALFIDRPTVQATILRHLDSRRNVTEWEEANLLRALLSARSAHPDLVRRARRVVEDRNRTDEVRAWATAVLGRFGGPGDHVVIERYATDADSIARASLLAVQIAGAALRGRVTKAVNKAYPAHRPLADKIRGRAKPYWPTFR